MDLNSFEKKEKRIIQIYIIDASYNGGIWFFAFRFAYQTNIGIV